MAFSAKSSNFARQETTTPIYIYTRMKIINSHYIPLPEPRWLIMDPRGDIYEQVGTLTVVEDVATKKGNYGIKTHSHPVVIFADEMNTEEDGDKVNIMTTLTIADGEVLDDVLLKDCTRLCPSKHRIMTFMQFNTLVVKLVTKLDEDIDLDTLIEDMKFCAIEFIFYEQDIHELDLTTMNYNNKVYIISDGVGSPQFIMPVYAYKDKQGVHIDYSEIFFEFVNQARAYLKINRNFHFHFNTSSKEWEPLVERLNNELNDYLERKEE